ncbi:tetratricopeptide repeat-containing sensor histidine kinase [Mucilaginibacter ginsenosidivorax]|uniref:histidine kinase n=1 Tax=Mucilaginibacter ginsenosidivorax TaxID=862126 RepID=A0A5B8W6U4_9SPHI|nr:tetratricopeptide repeat-containing sensor histidine kinase [Mucilaginibacter ginsenosidivorax]QEC78632.1 tetratricopeptide repeat protein [Mucilaginibacter ginsenosidivorax]
MNTKIWLSILSLFLCNLCLAYRFEAKPDSLRNELLKSIAAKKQVNDTAVINDLNKLAVAYTSYYPDSTIYYGQKATQISRTINYSTGIADGLLAVTTVYISQAKYDIVLKYIKESLALYTQAKNVLGISDCYKLYGDLYYQLSDYQKALSFYNKALPIKLAINDLPGLSRLYLSIGNNYDNLGHSSAALDYYFKALNIDTKLRNKKKISADYNNIGVVLQSMEIYPQALTYFTEALQTWTQMQSDGGISVAKQNIGEVLMAQGKYDNAIKYLNDALAIDQKQDDKDGISTCNSDLAVCYIRKKQNQKALGYLQLALKVATDNKMDYNKVIALINTALFYNVNHDYAKAYGFALQAKTLADHIGSVLLRTNAAVQLIETLGGLKLYKEAYAAQRDFDNMKRTFRKDESVQKFTLYITQYNYAEKQRQQLLQQKANALLYQQKLHDKDLLNIIFFIIITAVLLMAFLYYRQKQQQLKINTQLKLKNNEVLEQKVNIDEQAEKLNDLNKLKDKLISILAHDLRSPLSTLRGLFDLLSDESISHQEMLEMIPSVIRKLDYTSDFLDTLLFWINSQLENFNASGKSFSIDDIIQSEIKNHTEQASFKGITVIYGGNKELLALADPNSIRIVVRNLITNAIKFSGAGDVIEISATEQDENVLVTITDTGMGMPPARANKLFKSQVDSKSGTLNESGTGMGLLLCKDLVEKCKGRIWVTSKEGIGTKFSFVIPLQPTATMAPTEAG